MNNLPSPAIIDNRFYGVELTLKHLCSLKAYVKANIPNLRKIVKTDYIGEQTSAFHSRGMDFDEVRIYQEGDDIRSMDWRVTARTGKPHTKLYQQEREQPVFLITNLSNSMHFGTQVTFKSIVAAQATAFLAWKAITRHDRVGGILYNDSSCAYFNPSNSEKNLIAMFHKIIEFSSLQNKSYSNHQNVITSLQKFRKLFKAGSQIVIVSDFLDFDIKTYGSLISQFSHKNQVLFIFIYDQLEAEAPKPNWYVISDGNRTLQFDSSHKNFRDSYSESFQKFFFEIKKFAQQHNVKLLSLKTDDYIIRKLQRVF